MSLRELAKAATPGPWEADGPDIVAVHDPVDVGFVTLGSVAASNRPRIDAAYIAAVSPDVVLALLDALEWLIDNATPQHSTECFLRGDDEPCICGVSERYQEVLALMGDLRQAPRQARDPETTA